MTATPDGKGYWLTEANGAVFSFGDAHSYGSAAKPTWPSPSWACRHRRRQGLLADRGQRGRVQLRRRPPLRLRRHGPPAKPIVGMVATPDAKGYWLVAANGAVFGFGDAHFYGSTAKAPPGQAHRGHDRHA
jgi:hypothetical protein